MKIIVNPKQYRQILESQKKNIIINESQLECIREYENNQVLHHDFETMVRQYMDELKNHPCSPKFCNFFVENNIPENLLQKKMTDLGLIKRVDKITEPEDVDGKKHSVHTRKFIFSGKDFDKKIDQLYNTFFRNGERILTETDCGGAMGGGAIGSGEALSDGATNTQGVGGQYTVPFGGIQRRELSASGSTTASMDKVSNIDMKPTAERKKGGIIVNVAK